MKKLIKKLSESDVVAKFPIKDRILGWYFNCNEISNNAWSYQGTDLWGRTVGTDGSDYETTLQAAFEAARKINRSLGDYGGMTINERLVASGLMDFYESAAKSRDRERMIEILKGTGLTTSQCTESVDALLKNPSKYGY